MEKFMDFEKKKSNSYGKILKRRIIGALRKILRKFIFLNLITLKRNDLSGKMSTSSLQILLNLGDRYMQTR
jgi:hypothetical protein